MTGVPVGAAYSFNLSSSSDQATNGNSLTLKGTVQGLETTSVYLFVTGPGLDRDGATLEDIREASGSLTGMFTLVQVNIGNGTFQYTWDTSPFRTSMQPGEYTVYVTAAPMGLARLSESGEPFGSKTILFLGSDETLPPATTQSPLPPVLVLIAPALALLVATLPDTRRHP